MVRSSKTTNHSWIFVLLGIAIGLFVLVPLVLFASVLFLGGSSASVAAGNVAVIPVEGVIMATADSGPFASGAASSNTIVAQIHAALEDPQIEALVFDINSPGGSAVASDEIAAAILESTKPTVAVIREVGASGGYWIASATDHVIANRMSITGSIGVISSYLEFSGLFEDYGVSYQRLVAGDRKDIGSPFRELTASEETVLQEKIDLIHGYFIDAVAENRNLDRLAVDMTATGEFFLGVEALELGLVDQLGDMSNAKEYLYALGFEDVELLYYSDSSSLLDLLTAVSSHSSFQIGQGIGQALVQGPEQQRSPVLIV